MNTIKTENIAASLGARVSSRAPADGTSSAPQSKSSAPNVWNPVPASPSPAKPLGWHSRGYLPHFECDAKIQMVTFRLADSLPREVAARLSRELDTDEGNTAYRKRIEAWLDSGHGECWLRRPELARIVAESLRCFDGARYELHAWVIMPNHVHLLAQMIEPHLLLDAVRGWKSFTARKINQALRRTGKVWQREYWDRFIRDETHYLRARDYIHNNPVKAGLAARAESWPWSSAAA